MRLRRVTTRPTSTIGPTAGHSAALSESGGGLLQQPVSSIMTKDVIVAGPDDNMMMVMACMSNWRIRHLPVVEDGRPLGVISIGDVVKARISELEGQSETLRDFIEARRWLSRRSWACRISGASSSRP